MMAYPYGLGRGIISSGNSRCSAHGGSFLSWTLESCSQPLVTFRKNLNFTQIREVLKLTVGCAIEARNANERAKPTHALPSPQST